MSTGLFQNSIDDYDGTIPGAQQGLAAAMPVAGRQNGDWYLQTDTKKLYAWLLGVWVLVLDGSGAGVIPNLQQVTLVGATTDQNTTFGNGIQQWRILGTTGLLELFAGATLEVLLAPSDIVVFGNAGFWVEMYCNGVQHFFVFFDNNHRGRINCDALTADQMWNFPNRSGRVALEDQLTLKFNAAFAGVNGATVYNIAHGLGITPTAASITPKNANSATQLVGGYFLAYGPVTITLTLLVATIGTPALNFDFIATP